MKDSKLSKRLLQYSLLGTTCLATGLNANGQCGVADSTNPSLAVDIDGDGVADVNLAWSSTSNQLPLVYTGTGPLNNVPFLSCTTYSYFLVTVFEATLSYNGCCVKSISGGTNGAGPIGSLYAFACTTLITYVDTAKIQFNGVLNFDSGYFSKNLSYNTSFVNYANAYAPAGNKIVGLSNGSSMVCQNACAGGINVSLGSNINQFQAGTAYYLGQNGFFVGSISTFATVPPAPYSCITSNSLLAVPPGSYFVSNMRPVTLGASTLSFGTTLNSTKCIVENNNPIQFLGVKFKGPDQNNDGNPDTYNGWIEISIDPKTSAVTCVNKGFNSCSIENINLVNGTNVTCPSPADIMAGQADPGNNCQLPTCEADNGSINIQVIPSGK